MNMDASIMVSVSIGEALDKCSILQIKEEKLEGQQRTHVQTEKNALLPLVYPYIERFPRLYLQLVEVNTRLWDLIDLAREKGITDPTVMQENDARFRIKRKLNQVCSSSLQEQKNIPNTPYVVYIGRETPLLECTKNWFLEQAIYHDQIHIYTPVPSIWEPLTQEDPDIHVFYATVPPDESAKRMV